MDDAKAVGLVSGRTYLIENIHRPARGQLPFLFEDVGERAAIEVLHHQIRDRTRTGAREAEIGDVDDVRMAQPSGRLGLPAEALDELLVARELPMNDLDGDGACRPQVRRLVDGSHPSLPEQPLDQVFVVEPFSDEEVVQFMLLLSQPRLFRQLCPTNHFRAIGAKQSSSASARSGSQRLKAASVAATMRTGDSAFGS